MSDFIITEPGAYPGISAEDYHGCEICDAPSISSTGLKLINAKSLYHYWWQSSMNPNRPVRAEKAHFSIGSALHDLLLLDGRFANHYHILPADYDPRATKEQAEAIQAANYARGKGKTILTRKQADLAMAMAESVSRHELACALITAGETEMTLAAKDPETGVWLRARPDILPTTMEIIPDIKTAEDGALEPYERAATKWGYFQSAAHYMDVIDLLYGYQKRRFVLITVEKSPPYVVVIDHLDDEDINLARLRNRASLNKFAQAVRTGKWPAYTSPENPIRQLLMANHERALINQMIDRGELSYNS